MTAAVATAVVSTLTALALLLERVTGFVSARKAARSADVVQAATVAAASASMAGAVQEILAPLQAEVKALRAEVRALRRVLDAHGIPIPTGPFTED